MHGKLIFVNAAAEQFVGYPREELLGQTFADFLTPESIETAVTFSNASEPGEDVGIFELDFGDMSGTNKTVETREQLVWDGDRIVAFQGIGRDITQRKRAEEALRALSARHIAILLAVSDIIMEVDANKVYTWANQAGFEFFGEDVIGKEASFYFEGEQDTYLSTQPLFDGSEDVFYVESWQRRRNGEKRLLGWWCRALKDENGKVTGALSSARDVTEQKAAEDALRESEARLRLAYDAAKAGAWEWDIKTNKNIWSDEIWALYGLEPGSGEPSYELWAQTIHPEDRPAAEAAVHNAARSGTELNAEWRINNPDGQERWLMSRGQPQRDENDRVVRYRGIVIDITERKQAEVALRVNEERFRISSTSVSDLVWDWNIEAGELDWYGDIDEMLGYSSGEFPRTIEAWEKSIHPEDRKKVMAALEEHLNKKAPYSEEYRVIREDGTLCYWTDRGTAMRDEKGNAYRMVGACSDITERKRAERALRDSEQRYRELVEDYRRYHLRNGRHRENHLSQ